MDHETLGGFFKVDAVFAGAVPVQGAVGATDRSKAVGVLFKKIGGEDVELAQNLDLQGGGQLGDFCGAGGGEDDLKRGHGIGNLNVPGGGRSRAEALV